MLLPQRWKQLNRCLQHLTPNIMFGLFEKNVFNFVRYSKYVWQKWGVGFGSSLSLSNCFTITPESIVLVESFELALTSCITDFVKFV